MVVRIFVLENYGNLGINSSHHFQDAKQKRSFPSNKGATCRLICFTPYYFTRWIEVINTTDLKVRRLFTELKKDVEKKRFKFSRQLEEDRGGATLLTFVSVCLRILGQFDSRHLWQKKDSRNVGGGWIYLELHVQYKITWNTIIGIHQKIWTTQVYAEIQYLQDMK